MVVLRDVLRGSFWWIRPAAVVQDDGEWVVLYWPAGTVSKVPNRRATPRDLLDGVQLPMVDHCWVETDVLQLCRPGACHSIYAMWHAGRAELKCWYINLQQPLRRTAQGFDTMDHLLDIMATPDRTSWRWKDEDEFAEASRIGVYSADQADAIRVEGERAAARMQAGEPPFCEGWERWRPPAAWAAPILPTGWDEPTL